MALGKIAAKNASRYAMTSIRIERRHGAPRALATDGHRAVIFTWDEPDSAEYPTIDGMNCSHVDDFAANIPFDALAGVGKGLPRRSFKPVLGCMLLDESDRKTLRLAATTLDRVTRAEATADDVDFPPLDDVVPRPGEEKTLFDPVIHGDVPFTHVRIAVNAKLLAEMLSAMVSMASDQADDSVTLTVPIMSNRPIRLDVRGYDRSAVGAVMPVHLPQDGEDAVESTSQSAAPATTPTAAVA
jgi:hypothetical protein